MKCQNKILIKIINKGEMCIWQDLLWLEKWIHHSDKDGKYKFRDVIEDELRTKGNSAKIIAVDENNSVFFI